MSDGKVVDEERRKDGRHPIELKVEYQRLNTFFSDYTRNISKGGTFIRTNRPLDVGTEFIFKLYIPRLDEPLRIRGQVQWVVSEAEAAADAGGDDGPGMGIRFQFADDEERKGIERTVERLMVDSLGQLLTSRLLEQSRRTDPE